MSINKGEHYRKGRRYGRTILSEHGIEALRSAVAAGERIVNGPDAEPADRHEFWGLRSILHEQV